MYKGSIIIVLLYFIGIIIYVSVLSAHTHIYIYIYIPITVNVLPIKGQINGPTDTRGNILNLVATHSYSTIMSGHTSPLAFTNDLVSTLTLCSVTPRITHTHICV